MKTEDTEALNRELNQES